MSATARLHAAVATGSPITLSAEDAAELVERMAAAVRVLEEGDAKAVLDAFEVTGDERRALADRLRVADMATGRAQGYRGAAILVRRELSLPRTDAPLGDQGLTPAVAG